MRAIGVHEDVVVVTSAIWQTTATAVRAGGEAFLIDSPVLPDELDALPALCEQAGFAVVGLLATHADWDHLLGRYPFPGAALGVGESTAARLAAEPGVAQRELRDFDEDYLIPRPGPLSLGDVQALPLPGRCELAGAELELHPAGGHTGDGMAVWVPWARVLVVGDYLSPAAIPEFGEGGSIDAYLATLARLEPLVEQVAVVVPGHGEPLDAARAAAILREDATYLEALRADGATAPLPLARRTGGNRRIHAANVALLGEGTGAPGGAT
jgi:glyoxylase-like metal-dependent hydrolase (beta-lactamase superfamily II)